MVPMAGVLINAAIFCVGLLWVFQRRERVWRDLVWVILALAAVTVLECLCGICRFGAAPITTIALVHGWLGHVLVMADWCLTVAVVAAGVRTLRHRPLAMVGVILLIVFLLLLVLLESFTGYLPIGLDPRKPGAVETRHRFFVLHCIATPLAILVASTIGAVLLRKTGQCLAPRHSAGSNGLST